jgi:ADP-ribose pyrophosphatase YjhB (NUDIX family)
MELQVGVKILLKNREDEYLLVRRSLKKYPDIEGRWDIVGGRIEVGTSLMDNLRREMKEETKLGLVGEPRLMAAQDILRSLGRHVIRLTYVGEASGDIELDPEENDKYQWLTKDELIHHEDLDVYFKELLDKGSIEL